MNITINRIIQTLLVFRLRKKVDYGKIPQFALIILSKLHQKAYKICAMLLEKQPELIFKCIFFSNSLSSLIFLISILLVAFHQHFRNNMTCCHFLPVSAQFYSPKLKFYPVFCQYLENLKIYKKKSQLYYIPSLCLYI